MAVEVVMPALGMAQETCRLVRWLKREGEVVAHGEPLLEVEVDKGLVEVESPGSGVLSGLRVREGDVAPPGTVLAYLLAPAVRPAASAAWRTMAEGAARSWREVPHLFLLREVDASQLVVAGSRLPEGAGRTDLLVRLAAVTLARHREMNSGRDEVNIAVSLESGGVPVTAVIRRADGLDVPALAARRAELLTRCRAGSLDAEDVSGATFTVADLGEHGVDAVLPLVTEGQAGALAAGRVADRVVPVLGRPQVRPVLALTLACDQRAVDAVRAARFLRDLAEALEEPAGLL